MAKTNVVKKSDPIYTHEGAKAVQIDAEKQLRRSVMACLLWEDAFYEDGVSIADRIAALVPAVSPERVAEIAIEARENQHLRHAPLYIVREMCRHAGHRALVKDTLARVIQRADELAEFLAIYWKDGKETLCASAKKGLAAAFSKFDEYQLAKYDREGNVRLRDVLFLCHAKPADDARAALYKRIAERTLAVPDTWETQLSAGHDKRETFERLMAEGKLHGLATLRNLRNMQQAGIEKETIAAYLQTVSFRRVLPFRFIAAARAVPQWEDIVEPAMFRVLADAEKLPGKTVLVVDNSGSMYGPKISAKSEINRVDAACALAILIREICADATIIGFGNEAAIVPNRRGFALADAIKAGPGGGTYTDRALALAEQEGHDQIIVVTDEQSHQEIRAPKCERAYFVNVASYRNGIGYGQWTHLDGWSEAIVDYIRAAASKQ